MAAASASGAAFFWQKLRLSRLLQPEVRINQSLIAETYHGQIAVMVGVSTDGFLPQKWEFLAGNGAESLQAERCGLRHSS